MAKTTTPRTAPDVPLLKVHQWLDLWDEIRFDPKARQARPLPHFYLGSMRASDLKSLTGVYRRSTKGGTPRAKDPNVQRGHEEERSRVIRDFVQYGFPWCDMGEAKRNVPDAKELRKPGWLPTAIIVNVLEEGATRNSQQIPNEDVIHIRDNGTTAALVLPKGFGSGSWEPKRVYPLEVIDGQHRLWAFESFDPKGDFDLPVVIFHGLDRSWQAYLFWSVNITPKRINRSLAFDLYPLLRREDWLDRFSGHSIYRETRSQELVESLWSHPESPWFQRINMLGETSAHRGNDVPMVTQAAWIRSLMATFVKEWSDLGKRAGGLFGAPRSADAPLLPWNRAMQAAYLIYAGRAIRDAIEECNHSWAKQLRRQKDQTLFEKDDDPAFYGKFSLLTTDQGIRGILSIVNDLSFAAANDLDLAAWQWEEVAGKRKGQAPPATDEESVVLALRSLGSTPAGEFLQDLAEGLTSYDWRTSSTPGLTEVERRNQAIFRGSSGYKELRQQLLAHIGQQTGLVGKVAKELLKVGADA